MNVTRSLAVVALSSVALVACDPKKPNAWGTQYSAASLPANENPLCFSTGYPAPWQQSFSLPGIDAVVSDRGTMLLSVFPGLYANTAAYTRPLQQGFHDSWYGIGISAMWDVQASGVDATGTTLTPLTSGSPVAVNYGGTIKVYTPWPASTGIAGYKSLWHDGAKITFNGPQNSLLLITLADGKNLQFDQNGWLSKTCNDPLCAYPIAVFTRDPATQHLVKIDDYTVGTVRTTTLNWDTNGTGYFTGITSPAGTWGYLYKASGIGYTVTATPPAINGTPSNPWTYLYANNTNPQTITVTDPAKARSQFFVENKAGIVTNYFASDTRQNLTLVYSDLSQVYKQPSYTYLNSFKENFGISHCGCPAAPADAGASGPPGPFVDNATSAAVVCSATTPLGNTTAFTDKGGFVHFMQYTADGKLAAANDPTAILPGGATKDAFRVTSWSPKTGEWVASMNVENFVDPVLFTPDETHQGRMASVETPDQIVTQMTYFTDDSKWFAYNLPEKWTVSGAQITPIDGSSGAKAVSTTYTRVSTIDASGIITTISTTTDCPGCTDTSALTIPTASRGLAVDDQNYVSHTTLTCAADGTTCGSQLVGTGFFVNQTYNAAWQLASVAYNLGEANTDSFEYGGPGAPLTKTTDQAQGLAFNSNWDGPTGRYMGDSIVGGSATIDSNKVEYAAEPNIVASVVPNGIVDEIVYPAQSTPSGGTVFAIEHLDGLDLSGGDETKSK